MDTIYSARYLWIADLYEETVVQKESGGLSRTWDYNNAIRTINCFAESIQVSGIRSAASEQRWGSEYQDVEWIHLLSSERLDTKLRIGNIRDRNGVPMFDSGIVFNIVGITATGDIFGRIVEYEILANKATIS